ncbi:MAG: hypothetical protein ACRED1_11150 [Limisphaerales bacterium]
MRKSPIVLALAIAVALSATAINIAISQNASPATTFGGPTIPIPQWQYPLILLQPDDQCVPVSSNATFTVTALNADGYQWFFNGNALTNGTNSSFVVQNAGIKNVGLYSCDVFKGQESVPTRSAMLQVYTNWTDPQTGVDPVVVYSFPYPGSGGYGTCPGRYVGYVNFTKPYTNGWGWAPDTNNGNTVFTVSDGNQTNTKVEYVGAYGDEGCNQTTVTVPYPARSPLYRFTIYFTNSAPTNPYPITLSGFNP